MYAPLVLFVYKRADKLERCLKALEDNYEVENTDLYIFCDGPKSDVDIPSVQEVRKLVLSYSKMTKFKKVNIIESEQNRGLANSIINGVSEVVKKYGKVIVLEDDLLVKPNFLRYMNCALDFYEKYQQIGSISAYTLPLKELKNYNRDVYMIRKRECWGWGTWANRWNIVDWQVKDFQDYLKDKKKRKEFEKLQNGIDKMLVAQMEGKIDSWAVRWCYHLFENKLLTVYPKKSTVINIGMDGSGTHFTKNSNLQYSGKTTEEEVETIWEFDITDVDLKLEKKVSVFERNEDIKLKIKRLIRRKLSK